ncbi:MAG: hypothetical protein CL920_02400 [Deltaproteobacteria bacterium]|nr:hypothetical protein [Deltaproteobacteria bacterium]
MFHLTRQSKQGRWCLFKRQEKRCHTCVVVCTMTAYISRSLLSKELTTTKALSMHILIHIQIRIKQLGKQGKVTGKVRYSLAPTRTDQDIFSPVPSKI